MKQIESSFRDPSGHLFKENNILYRTINTCYKKHFDYLIKSGLYDHLVTKKLIVSHSQTNNTTSFQKNTYAVISPEIIPLSLTHMNGRSAN